MRLIQSKIDKMPFLDGLLIGVEEGWRLIPTVENTECIAVDERGWSGGETHHPCVEIFDHFSKAIEDGAVRFIENDKVEKSRREVFIANTHCLEGRHI